MFDLGSAQLQPYTRDILRRDRPDAERRSEPHQPVRAHRRQALRRRRARLQQLGAVGRSRQRLAQGAGRGRHRRREAEARGRHVLLGAVRRQRSVQPGEPAHRIIVLTRQAEEAAQEGQRRDQQGQRRRRRPARAASDVTACRRNWRSAMSQSLNRLPRAQTLLRRSRPRRWCTACCGPACSPWPPSLPAATVAATPWSWIEGPLAAALGFLARLPAVVGADQSRVFPGALRGARPGDRAGARPGRVPGPVLAQFRGLAPARAAVRLGRAHGAAGGRLASARGAGCA